VVRHRAGATAGQHRAPASFRSPGGRLAGLHGHAAAVAAVFAALVLLIGQPGTGPARTDPAELADNAALAGAAGTVRRSGDAGAVRVQDGAPAGAGDGVTPAVAPDRSAPTVVRDSGGNAARPAASPSRAAPVSPSPRPRKGPAGSIRLTGSAGVALTFDDGPDPLHTPQLLDLLRAHDVKATFCLVGTRVQAYPQLVRRIAADGHTLCNHSWRHRFDLGTRSATEIREDLQATNAAIRQAVPGVPVRYFRAPGGGFTPALVAVARQEGMRSLYWDVDPRDWDDESAATSLAHVERVVSTVQQGIRPGSIVLSHDFRQPTTVAAYAVLLPWLKARWQLVAMPADPSAPRTDTSAAQRG
jgi:peptidoglycan/xylan/chitin deacetylase (PgdA/CDA1 family)